MKNYVKVGVVLVLLALIIGQVVVVNEIREMGNENVILRAELSVLKKRVVELESVAEEMEMFNEVRRGLLNNVKVVSHAEFYDMLAGTEFGNVIVFTLDGRYMLVDSNEVKKVKLWIDNMWEPYNVYAEDFWDCDDIAFDFYVSLHEWAPIAVGVLMTTDHAYNVVFYLDGGQLRYFIYDATNEQYVYDIDWDSVIMLIV